MRSVGRAHHVGAPVCVVEGRLGRGGIDSRDDGLQEVALLAGQVGRGLAVGSADG